MKHITELATSTPPKKNIGTENRATIQNQFIYHHRVMHIINKRFNDLTHESWDGVCKNKNIYIHVKKDSAHVKLSSSGTQNSL
jgi:hypothetical protein